MEEKPANENPIPNQIAKVEVDEWAINPKERIKMHSSHIKSFLMCPAQFFFRYVRQIKTPSNPAIVLGKGVHKAAEINLVQKRETHADLAEDLILDAFSTSWEESHQQEVKYDPDEKRGDIKDIGVACTKALARVVMPTIQPKEVELKITTPIKNRNFDISGRIDTLDDKNIIRDFKTTGGYLSKNQMGQYIPGSGDIIQITQYSLQAKAAKIKVDGTELTYIHKKIPAKGGLPNVYPAPFMPSEDNQNAYLRIADKVAEAVSRESYVPNPTAFVCSPEKCGFWQFCRGGAIF